MKSEEKVIDSIAGLLICQKCNKNIELDRDYIDKFRGINNIFFYCKRCIPQPPEENE